MKAKRVGQTFNKQEVELLVQGLNSIVRTQIGAEHDGIGALSRLKRKLATMHEKLGDAPEGPAHALGYE